MGAEGQRPQENIKKDGITRRDFVVGAAGAFIGGAAPGFVERITEPEKQTEETVGRIILKSDIIDFKATEGQGIESFFEESGWHEYNKFYFKLAVEHLNPALKERQLQLNETIKIPVRKDENKE